MDKIINFLNYDIRISETIHIQVKTIFVVITVFIITALLLKLTRKYVTRKLTSPEKEKFASVFSFTKFIIYLIVVLITMQNMGVQLTAILAASAALLVGVGLALQTFFQDIISGIFIVIDKSVHVGDIIEVDGKVGRVVEIRLRTTRAETIDNKILIIPNHKFLVSILFNWTQNGTTTREFVEVGVAYGSDVELVKKLLVEAATSQTEILKHPEPTVLLLDFGDNGIKFRLVFTINNSFLAIISKSNVRYTIDKLFREHNIVIPFPQRDVYLHQ